jgi:hypothetical protein
LAQVAVRVALVFLLAGLLAPAAQAGDRAPSRTESQFVGLLNQARLAHDLPAVQISPALTGIADDYAAFNSRVGGIDHSRDRPYTRRANRAGCDKWSGPVLAQGYPSARAVLKGWLASSGHRRVLLDPEITHIGPGIHGQYALAFGMPCLATVRNSSGDYGDPKAIGRRLSLTVTDLEVGGASVAARVMTEVGSRAARLVGKSSATTASGQERQVAPEPPGTRLSLALPNPGDWRVDLRVGDAAYALGIVRVRGRSTGPG